jgi:hypothetical protein
MSADGKWETRIHYNATDVVCLDRGIILISRDLLYIVFKIQFILEFQVARIKVCS